MERTMVLLKPDAVQRRLVGRIVGRLEDAGLDVERIGTERACASQVGQHYPEDETFLDRLGASTVRAYEAVDADCSEDFGTSDRIAIGRQVREWLIEYMTSGPVVKIILRGPEAVKTVRRIVGSTLPTEAHPGSIRGAWANDSPTIAGAQRRAVWNLVHASGTIEEAQSEIRLWFPEFKGGVEEGAIEDMDELRTEYENARTTDPRRAGEMAYALAVIAAKKGTQEEAAEFGRQAVELLEQCTITTIDDACARHTVLAGVCVPDYVHEDVVRDRLGLLGVRL